MAKHDGGGERRGACGSAENLGRVNTGLAKLVQPITERKE